MLGRIRSITFALLLVSGTNAFAHGMVSFPPLVGKASGYLADAEGKGRHPGLIVIQEWWGLNDWIRQQADRYAKAGYVALAPDLYRGKSTADPNVAHELMRGLPQDRAIALRGRRIPVARKMPVGGAS